MSIDTSNFQTLAAQVSARLAAEIARGTWVDWLPSERVLTDRLRVSRKTVRKALRQLKREGQVATVSGQGHRIMQQPQGRAFVERSVGLLTIDPLDHLRPFTTFWVDELRASLFEKRAKLATFSGQRFFTARARTEVARLVQANPQTCWVLAHTDERVQQWFYDRQVPCVIAGSCHRGLPLCSVDLDYFAICRHAVGMMRRHGHRQIALLSLRSQRVGDLESEAGFVAGMRSAGFSEVEGIIQRHDGSVASALHALERLFTRASRPTAILITTPAHYLTAVSFLAQHRLRVPADVSLVARDDESYLAFLNPLPARYSRSPRAYAKRLVSAVVTLMEGGSPQPLAQRIEPEFISGPSLATLRPGG